MDIQKYVLVQNKTKKKKKHSSLAQYYYFRNKTKSFISKCNLKQRLKSGHLKYKQKPTI